MARGLLGHSGDDLGVPSVLSSDLDDMEAKARWKPEHPDDVHPDTGLLCLGSESRYEGGYQVEQLAGLSGHWNSARMLVGDVHCLGNACTQGDSRTSQ